MNFSIIVVSYNAGDKLKLTLESIQEQTYQSYEVIVKDGCSTDGSIELVAPSTQVFVYVEKDYGIYDAMNQGIQYANGSYVLFLNCGDTFYKNTVLEEVAAIMLQNQAKGIYYGETYQEIGNSIEVMPHTITPFTCYRHMPCHQAIFYERALLLERPYDTKYRVRADYDQFLWAYFVKEIRPYYLNCVVASYEGGGYSETRINEKVSVKEHKAITSAYIPKQQVIIFRLTMVLTLVPVRRRLARSRRFSNAYSKLKKVLYHKG